MRMKNLFSDIPDTLNEELIETISSHPNARIERIVSHGHASQEGFWYDQDEDEFVLLVKGEAELEFEDDTIHLKPGDYLTIAAHRKHRVKWTTPEQPTIWLAVHF
jgi:cupin 2 domain-containing protein